MHSTLRSLVAGMLGGILVLVVGLNSPRVLSLVRQSGPALQQPAVSVEPSASLEELTSYEQAVIGSVEKANPAVVSIVVTKDVPVIEQFFEEVPFGPSDPFGLFGNRFSPFRFRVPQFRENGTERREVGGGSGFLVSADGMIVTNRHVVEADDVEYTVFMNDGERFVAEVIARDPVNDLAVLKIEGSALPFLEFADSEELKVGQTVIAIGNALAEFRNTVSVGVISGLARSVVAGDGRGQSEQLDEVIQTDAAINPGNSGGPLLNLQGKVIGVNVAVALGSENIGFALPGPVVRDVVGSVQETGRIVRPFLGVRYVPVTPAMQEANGLSVDHGVLILRGETTEELAVIPGSPADKAGLLEGDIILEVDGERLDGERSLAGFIRNKGVGDALTLKVLSKGVEKQVTVVLEAAPS